jgi:hypothetical protein
MKLDIKSYPPKSSATFVRVGYFAFLIIFGNTAE